MDKTDESSAVINEIKEEKPTVSDLAENGQQDVEMKESDQSASTLNDEPTVNGVKIEEDEKPVNSSNSIKDEEVSDEVEEEESGNEELEDEHEEESKPKETLVTHQSPKILYQEPLFAEICSFFNIFGTAIGLKYSIGRLEQILCTHVNGKGRLNCFHYSKFLNFQPIQLLLISICF